MEKYPFFRMGFIDARAMADGALAVAMEIGDEIAVMRLYVEEMTARHRDDWHYSRGFSTMYRKPDNRVTSLDMKFIPSEVIIMSREEFDERTYPERLQAYQPKLTGPGRV